jgi:hypothetical protein
MILKIGPLKGPSHEIFDLRFFFHQSNPPRPLIHALKYFQIRGVNREYMLIIRYTA